MTHDLPSQGHVHASPPGTGAPKDSPFHQCFRVLRPVCSLQRQSPLLVILQQGHGDKKRGQLRSMPKNGFSARTSSPQTLTLSYLFFCFRQRRPNTTVVTLRTPIYPVDDLKCQREAVIPLIARHPPLFSRCLLIFFVHHGSIHCKFSCGSDVNHMRRSSCSTTFVLPTQTWRICISEKICPFGRMCSDISAGASMLRDGFE